MRPSREERKLRLQRRLQKAKTDPHGLSAAAEFYGALIAALIDEEPTIERPARDAPSIEAKLAAGQPILYDELLGFDADAIRTLLLKLCEVTEHFGQPEVASAPKRFPWSRPQKAEQTAPREHVAAGDRVAVRALAAAQIRQALETGVLDCDTLLEHLALGHDNELASLATEAQLDPGLLTMLARFAMRPTMLAYADAFADAVRAHSDKWMRGGCPVCGGTPLLSEYRDADQSRHLRCATCGASWLFRRLECPHCGTAQFRALSYIKLSDDSTHQVDTCDQCHRYLKGVAASDAVPSDLLPLEDLLTLHLDVAAQAKGYQRM